MKKTDLAYMAGFFDGEGCICISYNGRNIRLRCNVSQCNEWILQLFKMRFGGSVKATRRRGNQRQCVFSWYISGNDAKIFLETLKPYLTLKRAEAEIAIEFQSGKGKRGQFVSDERRAVEEAQRILVQNLKQGKKANHTKV